MRSGDWEAAWQQTDRIELPRRERQKLPDFVRQPGELVWDGRSPAGRSVLVRCLHGLGDTLQFMRFVPAIAAQARELHFLVQPSLLELLQGVPGLGQVSNAWTDHPPPHELEIEVMELPYVLRSTAATVPPPLPQLRQSVRERQVFVLPSPPEDRRVALFWTASDWDPSRSVPLASLAPLLRTPHSRFYDLQHGHGRDSAPPEEAELAARSLVPLYRHTESVLAAAAALDAMDLVIAVDGMPVHLAASLGVPTWVLLKHDADWRWGDADDTPWYPGMRLFRQRRPGDWGSVIERVCEAFDELVKRPPPR